MPSSFLAPRVLQVGCEKGAPTRFKPSESSTLTPFACLYDARDSIFGKTGEFNLKTRLCG